MPEHAHGVPFRHRLAFLYGSLIIWIAVILFLSSPQGSMAQTSRLLQPILEFILPWASEDQILFLHGFIRKCAHFTEYALLGLLSLRAFAASSFGFLRRRSAISSIMLVASVALLDEFNQSFEPSRTGSPWDVLLDLLGGVSAVLVWLLWFHKYPAQPKKRP